MINYLPPRLPNFGDDLKRRYPNETREVHEITLQVTEDCCLACTYCYQHNKRNTAMDFLTAKAIIDNLLNNKHPLVNTDNTFAIAIDFIGGEPLMEIDLLDQICEYTLEQLIKNNHPWLRHIRFSICSNGMLYFTPKVEKFFQKYNEFISFSISIDGNKELHDQCRLDLNGNGSYDRAMAAVKAHEKKYGEKPSTKMTLAPANIDHTYEALLNLVQEGYTIIPFNCVFEEGWEYEHAIILYHELKKMADYLITNNLFNKVNVRMFQEDGYAPMSEEENNNWCGGVDMKCMAYDYKGDMYPCIRYMDSSLNGKQPALHVGNVFTGYQMTQQEKDNLKTITEITRRSQSTDECFYCPIARGCAWCSGYNYEEFGTPNKRATYICCMHKATALANVYYWNTLYKYLNIDKKFIMHIPKEWALNIIDENEYNYLLTISN